MGNYLELIERLRDVQPHECPLIEEAADAIETLVAELHRAEYIIQEQARAFRRLQTKGKREA